MSVWRPTMHWKLELSHSCSVLIWNESLGEVNEACSHCVVCLRLIGGVQNVTGGRREKKGKISQKKGRVKMRFILSREI